MNFIVFDGPYRNNLLPFTFTRPVADIRVGILTIREKWESYLDSTTTTVTEDYLSDKFPMVEMENNIMINASFLPNTEVIEFVRNLRHNQALFKGEDVIAFFAKEGEEVNDFSTFEAVEFIGDILTIRHTWDIFSKNGEAIIEDFRLITKDRQSQLIPASVNTINPENIFIEEGATLNFATLNASLGPIYIGRDAEVMEGSVVRGPLALCNNAVLKLGTKVYGPTTVGPYSKIGGEVNNSVIFSFSNKGHDGFLGNSVIGEWCNLGADTNTSNLKNNYAEVKLWNYETSRFVKTGLQFCGLMMGDHSKCGINTMFNTGTVIGVSANIYGAGFPRNFIPSFNWGGPQGNMTYKPVKAYEVAEVVMKRRGLSLEQVDIDILDHVYEQTAQYRKD